MQHPDDPPTSSQLSEPVIARLSEDLLYTIFMQLHSSICFPGESDDMPYNAQSSKVRLPKRVQCVLHKVPLWVVPVVVSQVCSRWRALTFSVPPLWSFIRITGTFPNRMMMANFFERSQNAPLSILFTQPAAFHNLPYSGNYNFDLLAMATEVAELSGRIRELGIVLPAIGIRLILGALINYAMPNLHKLWLYSPDVANRSPIPITNVNPLSVRVLHARHTPIQWLPFEGLVHLEISAGPAPTLPALLFTLKSSPLLETLSLRIPMRHIGEEAPNDKPPIELLRLQDLRLGIDKQDDAAFAILPYISFPSTTAVQFHFAGQLSSCLYERNDSLRDIATTTQRAYLTADTSRDVVTIESDDPALFIEYNGTVFVTALPWPPIVYQHHARLCEGFLAAPLPALTYLSVCIELWDNPSVSSMQFNILFDSVASIVELSTYIHVGYVEYIATALSKRMGGNDTEAGSLRCPNLRRWSLKWSGQEPSVDDYWRIERCCAARAEAGVPIEYLETTAFPPIVLGTLERSVAAISTVEH
ncbi:hypothetical protein C8Q79DRAFT_908395 [Trametes meyenii]|nr:hypothetical protein C8Q79DRAFT_908395 [Trametes meyenii]